MSKNTMQRIFFDLTEVEVEGRIFRTENWEYVYGDVEEDYPPNTPEPQDKEVVISLFVYVNHAGNKITQISHTGIIIFTNNSLIQVFCKQKNTIESSTFRPDLVALRIVRYFVSALGIKTK